MSKPYILCVEYDEAGHEVTRYRLKDLPELPSNALVWHERTRKESVKVVCGVVRPDG